MPNIQEYNQKTSKQANKQTVNGICTSCLWACVD